MLNIVIPMAGRGSRFNGPSQTRPKPLIEVVPGRTMIELVVRYLTPAEPHRFIFVCLEKHVQDHRLETYFRTLTPHFTIVGTEKVTEGPASTALLAARLIDSSEDLLVAYCDDSLDIDVNTYLRAWRMRSADGGILLFPSGDPKNSYAITDENGRVLKVAEKVRISGQATAGLYYFGQGSRFVRAARRMVAANRRSSGEFFVSTVYNEMIGDGDRVIAYRIPAAANRSMGTPEELCLIKTTLAGL